MKLAGIYKGRSNKGYAGVDHVVHGIVSDVVFAFSL